MSIPDLRYPRDQKYMVAKWRRWLRRVSKKNGNLGASIGVK
jgi:hypothetical protein